MRPDFFLRSGFLSILIVITATLLLFATSPASARTFDPFVGCYKDTSDFDLNGYLERSAQNTPERCIAICAAKGFPYAAVEYGESCLCGASYGRYGAADNGNYRCTGDAGQICGGYSANSVYVTGIGDNNPPGLAASNTLVGKWRWDCCGGGYAGYWQITGLAPDGSLSGSFTGDGGHVGSFEGRLQGEAIEFVRR